MTTEIDDALVALGVTQSELARLLGVEPRTVIRWRQGRGTPHGRALPEPVARYLLALQLLSDEQRKAIVEARTGTAPLRSRPRLD